MHGHALVSALVAVALLGIGAAGTLHWVSELLALERHLQARALAVRALQAWHEQGQPEACQAGAIPWPRPVGPAGPVGMPQARHTLPLDPNAPGAPSARAAGHQACEVSWIDPWGREQSLRLGRYTARQGRAY